MADWSPGRPDVECTSADVASMTQCNADHLEVLDEQDQSQNTTATFELIKIAELSDPKTCIDVREALPAIERSTPTITCR
jgi:hypothetical protein